MSSPTDEEDDSFEDAILTAYEFLFQESRVELLTDLYTQIDLGLVPVSSDATIRLARSGWSVPKNDSHSMLNKSTLPSEVISPIAKITPPSEVSSPIAPLKFMLPDLEEPPSGASLNDVVREMRPLLTQAIKDARSCIDGAPRSNPVTQEDIRKRYPLLEYITDAEYDQYIVGRGEKPHKASGLLMVGRTELPIETINRYCRPTPPGRSKSKRKAEGGHSKE